MDDDTWLAKRFEAHRGHLRSVAYRMLGSLTEADDAVQEAWLRLARSDADAVHNLGGWLTTVVSRVCLDMLRSRRAKREEAFGVHLPDPVVRAADDPTPEQEAVLADSVGLALQVVLDQLNPAERLAFVLHDMFGMPFEEIAPIVGRTPGAATQLASRARRRVRGAAPVPDVDLAGQRRVVDAFVSASRDGDFDALVAVLDPDVVLRANYGRGEAGEIRGAENVARQAILFRATGAVPVPATINGAAGVVSFVDGTPLAIFAPTVRGGRIVEIDILADKDRVAALDLSAITARG